jgi:hypothetical protein
MKKLWFGAGVSVVAVLMLLPVITPVNQALSKIHPGGKTTVADGVPLPPPTGGGGQPPAKVLTADGCPLPVPDPNGGGGKPPAQV